MRCAIAVLCALTLTACSAAEEGLQTAQQAIETGKQAVEAGKQAVEAGKQLAETGKQLAESELGQQLKAYLQEKYNSSERLRKAMLSGDGALLMEELKNTELYSFSLYRSEIFGIEYTGHLVGDGTFQIKKHNLRNPAAGAAVVKKFKVSLDSNGQIRVQEQ